jgi:hypothetical protein
MSNSAASHLGFGVMMLFLGVAGGMMLETAAHQGRAVRGCATTCLPYAVAEAGPGLCRCVAPTSSPPQPAPSPAPAESPR